MRSSGNGDSDEDTDAVLNMRSSGNDDSNEGIDGALLDTRSSGNDSIEGIDAHLSGTSPARMADPLEVGAINQDESRLRRDPIADPPGDTSGYTREDPVYSRGCRGRGSMRGEEPPRLPSGAVSPRPRLLLRSSSVQDWWDGREGRGGWNSTVDGSGCSLLDSDTAVLAACNEAGSGRSSERVGSGARPRSSLPPPTHRRCRPSLAPFLHCGATGTNIRTATASMSPCLLLPAPGAPPFSRAPGHCWAGGPAL